MRSARYLLKTLLFTLLSGILWFSGFSASPVSAADEFTHTIRTDYFIREDKSTYAEYTFTTTNKVSNNYLRTFSINLPFLPKNLASNGSKTAISIGQLKQISARNVYTLDIEFPTPIYGLNRVFEWRLTFEVEKFVIDHGVQSAIIIPAFNNQSSITGYEISARIPNSYGDVRSIYGNAAITKGDTEQLVVFKSGANSSASHIILLGSDQEYYYETLKVTDGAKIYLPKSLPYQIIGYTQFPERKYTTGDTVETTMFQINSDEAIKAFIKTTVGYDQGYSNEKDSIVDTELIRGIIGKIDSKLTSNSDIARAAYDAVTTSFELNDYITNVDTTIDLKPDKAKVNPAELNRIYRQVLSHYSIENRGVFGYVFPIQPFQRNEYVTEQHVWSEFWDGEKWISVDPTWKISSRGTVYFDKNFFHHVKFGTYRELSDLHTFFANAGLFKITPVKYESMIDRKLDIEMSAYNDTYLNKEFRVVITNKSNDIISLKSIYPSIDLKGVAIKHSKVDVNKHLYPNSQLTFTIPLEYGVIFKNKEGGVHIAVEYEDQNNVWSNKAFNHAITVRSNISRYLSQIILIVVIVFVFISIGSFTLYRKKM
jgi:transglutaminase-like putative cysteine protease